MNIFNQRMQFLMLVIFYQFGCKHQETVVTDTAKLKFQIIQN